MADFLRQRKSEVLLVSLGGAEDILGILGVFQTYTDTAEDEGRGDEWKLEEMWVRSGMSFLDLGGQAHSDQGGITEEEAGELINQIRGERRAVIVDCGNIHQPKTSSHALLISQLFASGMVTHPLLVTRRDYLALNNASKSGIPEGSKVVVVAEEGVRAFPDYDITDAVKASIRGWIPYDVNVANAVNAGFLASDTTDNYKASIDKLLEFVFDTD